MAGFRSYSKKEFKKAQKEGKTLWELDTANDGEDDILIGETEKEVVIDILHHHDLTKFPINWTLSKVEK